MRKMKRGLLCLLVLVLAAVIGIQPVAGTLTEESASQISEYFAGLGGEESSAGQAETAEPVPEPEPEPESEQEPEGRPEAEQPEPELDRRDPFAVPNAAEKANIVGARAESFSYGNADTDNAPVPYFYDRITTAPSGRYVYYFPNTAGVLQYRVYGSGVTDEGIPVRGFWTAENADGDINLATMEYRSLEQDTALFGRTEGGEAGPDDAVITSVEIGEITGVEPFDNTGGAGKDISPDDEIVRSFDTVTFNLKATMAVNDGEYGSVAAKKHYSFKGGKIYVKAVLPASYKGIMEWDLDSMPWAENLKKSSDGMTIEFYYQMGTVAVTIPGNQTLSLPLKVYGAANGTEIQPQFTLWMEGNETDPGHVSKEAKYITGRKIIVSAAPSYNLKLQANSSYVGGALADLNGTQGRVYGYTLMLQLHNTANTNNLKGVEFPTGEISFDLDIVIARAEVGGSSSTSVNVTNQMMVRLWDWNFVQSSATTTGKKHGRNMSWSSDARSYRPTSVPYSFLESNTAANRIRSIYNSGDWEIDEGTYMINESGAAIVRFHVTINDYDFYDTFPTRTIDNYSNYGNTDSNYSYTGNYGCFAVAYFQFFVDLPSDGSESATYTINLSNKNFRATSMSGQVTTTQTLTNDDSNGQNHDLRKPGSYYKAIHYYSNTASDGPGSMLNGSTWSAGDSSAFYGATLWLRSTSSVGSNNDYPIKAENLVTFWDAEGFRPTGKYSGAVTTTSHWTMLWGALPGGRNWTSDDEMKNAKEEDLTWYASLDALYAAGNKYCVASLGETKSGVGFSHAQGVYSGYFVQLAMQDTAEVGKVYMATNQAKMWINELNRSVYTRLNTAANWDTEDIKLGTGYYQNGGYCFEIANPSYKKTQYNPLTGAIVSGTPVGTPNYGNCVLIIGANVGISKTVLQRSSGNAKEVYNLAYNENIVQYRLSPTLTAGGTSSTNAFTTTVTVTDTLPAGLTYVAGSSSRGGTTGADGLIAAGSGLSFEPSVTVNGNGTTTLVWTIPNVAPGDAITPIDFQAEIDQTSPNNKQFTNKVVVFAPVDLRAETYRTDTYGIQVVNLADHKLFKTADQAMIEVGQDVGFIISYINNEEVFMNNIELYDMLPYNGDYRGTDYHGQYWLKSIDATTTTTGSSGTSAVDKFYYTTDTSLRNVTSESKFQEAVTALPASAWTQISDPSNIPRNIAQNIVALKMTGRVSPKSQMDVHLIMNVDGNEPGDVYGNSSNIQDSDWENALITPQVKEVVLTRSIEGVAWVDRNNDGERQDTERLISGLTVSLWKDNGDGTYSEARDLFGNLIPSVLTGIDGAYKFSDVPAGKFQIRFYGVDTDMYYVTTKQASGVSEMVNSDTEITPVKINNREYIVINNVVMPESKDVYVLEYRAQWLDMGITPIGKVSVTKTLLDENGNPMEGNGKTFYAALYKIETDGTETYVETGELEWNTATKAYDTYTFDHIEPGTYKVYELNDAGEIVDDMYKYFANIEPANGQITIDYDKTQESVNITNKRKVGDLNLTAKKQANQFTLKGNDFTFELAEDADFTTVLQTKTNTAAGAITFDTIQLLDEGTYVYYIREVQPTIKVPFIDYDNSVYKVTVTVKADATSLVPTIKYEVVGVGEKSEVVFSNQYLATGSVQFSAGKTVSYRQVETGQFQFELKLNGTVVQTKSNGSDGTITFDPLTYTQADIDKTYTYTIGEVQTGLPGFAYDNTIYYVKVTIADNGDGTLDVSHVIEDKDQNRKAQIEFANAYAASGSLTLTAEKTLINRPLETNQFEFELRLNGVKVSSAKNLVDGSITFDKLEYDQADIGKTFVYTVHEINDGQPGYTYDSAIYTVTVYINDNGNGTLTPQITSILKGADAASSIKYENTYYAEGELTIEGTKELTGRVLGDQQFSFVLRSSLGAELDTAQNGTDGSFAFNTLRYTQDDIGKTFIYSVVERNHNQAGYTYDDTLYTLEVLIVDNGDGTLTPQVTIRANGTTTGAIEFANVYNASGSTTISGDKTLAGRRLADGQFYFELYDSADNLLETVQNNTAGLFTFKTLEYNEFNAGNTYVYTVKERVDGAPGYAYDTSVFTVEVEVIDNGNGTLTCVQTIKRGGVEADLSFANVYEAYGEIVFEAEKSLDGRVIENEQFTFELRDTQNNVVMTATNDSAGKIVFDPLGFTEADADKIYVYTLRERYDGADGYTYDTKYYNIVLQILDNGDGTMEVKVVSMALAGEEVTELTFDNLYRADGGIILTGGKTLTGRVIEDGQFTFVLTDAEEAELSRVQNDADGNFQFPELTFDQYDAGKVFTYYVYEVDDSAPGYTYDQRVATMKIRVTDNGDGTLAVTIDSIMMNGDAKDTLAFSNIYNASGAATFSGEKTLSGRVMEDQQFVFQLWDADGKLLQTKRASQFGDFIFDAIAYDEFDAGKTFTYTVTERNDNAPGYTYDARTYTVTVVVTDNGDGTLDCDVMYTLETEEVETVAFANEYHAEGDYTVSGTKSLTGRVLEDQQFRFVLTDWAGNFIQEISHDADGTFVFDPLQYTEAHAGYTFTYKVYEVDAEAPGYTYDKLVYTIDITVTDNGDGTLTCTQTALYTGEDEEAEAQDALAFSNVYNASGSIILNGRKFLTGRVLENKQFSFELYQDGEVIDTATHGVNGWFNFTALEYNEFDAGKTFTYTIKEVNDGAPGYTYDDRIVTVIVTVVDNGDGTLTCTAEYTVDGETEPRARFYNVYEAYGEIVLDAEKTLDGRVLEDGQFYFELHDWRGGLLQTVQNDADGKVVFDALQYDQDDADEIFGYLIRERIDSADGYTYDGRTYTVVVHVTDNGDGTMAAEIIEITTAGEAAEAVVFENLYRADGEVTIRGGKELTGRVLESEQFQFVLTDGAGNILQTTTHGADGKFWFGALQFNQYDAGKTFTYKVYEYHANAPGYTYDPTIYTVTVTVTDNGDGTLDCVIASISINGVPQEGILFQNIYHAEGSIQFDGTKELAGRVLEDKQFSFQLQDADGNVLQTVTHDADGKFAFEPIEYNEFDAGKIFHYTIVEMDAEAPGYTYDKAQYDIIVIVTDNGDGTLTCTPTISKKTEAGRETVESIAFSNIYKANGEITLDGTKTLTGRVLEEEQFALVLADHAGNVQSIVRHDADGKFVFEPLVYNEAHAGYVFEYIVYEIDEEHPGYIYSDIIYNVKISVTDNGDGTLDVQIASIDVKGEEKDGLVFDNVYHAEGSVQFDAVKALDGRVIEDGQFTFELRDADGNVLQSKTNDADGTIGFDTIEYNEFDAGKTFKYTIAEVNDGNPGYTYDETRYEITVVVTDNGDGTLDCAVTIVKVADGTEEPVEDMEFLNLYRADGEITFDGTKELTGRVLENEQFTFELHDWRGGLLQTVQNDADGSFQFETIRYNQYDAGELFGYVIREQIDGADGYTYDEIVYSVVVKVTDNGDGTLKTEIISMMANGSEQEAVFFGNVYNAEGAVQFGGTKELTGRVLEDEQFTFNLFDADGKWLQTAKNDADGTFLFETIEYNEFDAGKTFRYVVAEVDAEKPGYTYDAVRYEITVAVTDNGDGTLDCDVTVVRVSGDETEAWDENLVFQNIYEAQGEILIEGRKLLTGTELQDGFFGFELYDEEGTLIETTENDLEGLFSFLLSYNESHAGNLYTYTVRERNDGAAGYVYDESVYTLVIAVEDNGDGTLSVSLVSMTLNEQEATELIFNNQYLADGETLLKGIKYLEGKQLTASQFAFELYDNAGKLLQTVRNTANGMFYFEPLGFTQDDAGKTYKYLVSEKAEGAAGYTYDTAIYNVTVTVEDNGDGTLDVQTVYTKADGTEIELIEFRNSYKPAEEMGYPLTYGDYNYYTMMLYCGAAAMFVLLVSAKRKKEQAA